MSFVRDTSLHHSHPPTPAHTHAGYQPRSQHPPQTLLSPYPPPANKSHTGHSAGERKAALVRHIHWLHEQKTTYVLSG